jgi:hypothetical protein
LQHLTQRRVEVVLVVCSQSVQSMRLQVSLMLASERTHSILPSPPLILNIAIPLQTLHEMQIIVTLAVLPPIHSVESIPESLWLLHLFGILRHLLTVDAVVH